MARRSRIITFSVSLLLWLLLSFGSDWQHLLAGTLASLLVAFTMGDLFTEYARKWFNPRRYFWFIVFMLVFIRECIKANFDVAWIVLHPDMPIKPGIVKIKTGLKGETALTFLANFITLTPGTLTVDIDRENSCLYIHWIYVEAKDIEEATRRISMKFEPLLKEVFE